MPCQARECPRASVICVCADVGATCHGDVSVVYPACDDPHQRKNRLHCGSWSDAYAVETFVTGVLHHQGTVSDAAWRLYHENSVEGSSPDLLHRPKGCESGVCGAWTNLPCHVSTAGQSGRHGIALPPLHRHPGVASSVAAIDLLRHLTRASPNSAPYACARDPMSHLGHAPIDARVRQPPPPVLEPCGLHAAVPRAPCGFQQQKGPASAGCSYYGHPYCE